ncbi:LysM peptidoglycan-binding domain-containing protein [Verrucomicrobiota bacterium]
MEFAGTGNFIIQIPQKTGKVYYVVGVKEKLPEITKRFGLSTKHIMRVNNISNPDWIHAGDTIILWPAVIEHTVAKGEWLIKIAREYETTVGAIKEINNLKSSKLHIGQKLIVPAKIY